MRETGVWEKGSDTGRGEPFELDRRLNTLKWYYDQKIISFFSSDFESVQLAKF